VNISGSLKGTASAVPHPGKTLPGFSR